MRNATETFILTEEETSGIQTTELSLFQKCNQENRRDWLQNKEVKSFTQIVLTDLMN
jgi:hypothetical protein